MSTVTVLCKLRIEMKKVKKNNIEQEKIKIDSFWNQFTKAPIPSEINGYNQEQYCSKEWWCRDKLGKNSTNIEDNAIETLQKREIKSKDQKRNAPLKYQVWGTKSLHF